MNVHFDIVHFPALLFPFKTELTLCFAPKPSKIAFTNHDRLFFSRSPCLDSFPQPLSLLSLTALLGGGGGVERRLLHLRHAPGRDRHQLDHQQARRLQPLEPPLHHRRGPRIRHVSVTECGWKQLSEVLWPVGMAPEPMSQHRIGVSFSESARSQCP